MDIDGYLTKCSALFPDAENDIDGLREDVDANTAAIAEIDVNAAAIGVNTAAIDVNTASIDVNTKAINNNSAAINGNSASINVNTAAIDGNSASINEIEADIASIQETLARIADVDGETSQSLALFHLDMDHQNHLLVFSVIINVILVVLTYCMYSTIKNNKQYAKVTTYTDSEN